MHGRWRHPLPPADRCPALRVEASGREKLLRLQPRSGQPPLALIHPDDFSTAKHRLPILLPVASRIALMLQQRWPAHGLALQLHDEDPQVPCLRFDAAVDDLEARATLVPDPYCLGTKGYAQLRRQMVEQPLPPWQERLPVAFWRGASTGSKDITPDNLHRLPRYQLCRWTQRLPQVLDARFNRVVQTLSPSVHRAVETELHRQDLLRPTVTPWHAALHRWLLDIDGNVNSWGLLWKLLSGSCVLRVQSQRCQWYHRRIQPWRHWVPIKADLSDLDQQLHWCRTHTSQCAAIAAAGRQLALEVVAEIDDDLSAAATRLLQCPVR